MAYETAVILGLIGVIACLIYLKQTLDNEYKPLQLFIFFIVWILLLFSVVMMQHISTNENVDSNLDVVYQIILWSFFFCIGYIFITFITNIIKNARKIRFEGGEEE